jgi:hypothetical protein
MRDVVILVPLIIVVELVFALLCLLPLGIVWVIMYYFYLMMKSYMVGPLFDLLWFGIGLYFFVMDRINGRSFMKDEDKNMEDQ